MRGRMAVALLLILLAACDPSPASTDQASAQVEATACSTSGDVTTIHLVLSNTGGTRLLSASDIDLGIAFRSGSGPTLVPQGTGPVTDGGKGVDLQVTGVVGGSMTLHAPTLLLADTGTISAPSFSDLLGKTVNVGPSQIHIVTAKADAATTLVGWSIKTQGSSQQLPVRGAQVRLSLGGTELVQLFTSSASKDGETFASLFETSGRRQTSDKESAALFAIDGLLVDYPDDIAVTLPACS